VTWFEGLVSRGVSTSNANTNGTRGNQKDPEYDRKVARGLAQSEREEAAIDAKDNDGKLTKAQAEQVAKKVKSDNPIFRKIVVHYNPAQGTTIAGKHKVNKPEIVYEWFASNGVRVSSRKPYTDDLEPAADEGTKSNPFPIAWPKPASIDYPKIYLGGQRTTHKSQAELKALVGQKDDTGTVVQEYAPHNISRLSNGRTIGLGSNWYFGIASVIGPLKALGIPLV
jgi:hypothetical protein